MSGPARVLTLAPVARMLKYEFVVVVVWVLVTVLVMYVVMICGKLVMRLKEDLGAVTHTFCVDVLIPGTVL